ncbi:MAG TPA: hypothetical protein VGV37_13270 [Aliidongia sp.]|uniref:hypothetical protein n=1 Tax=Aliidongia sp. TaxID=1914230 RepID=UPI002DDC9FF0|nr:hypothetical protein [Aliidongia sp.]HEV2675508.1 hypothetical protein [Aliidongia sp.]
MQDRYAGDIGDYLKLAILRSIMPEHRLGVAWWMYPDEGHNGDGRHTDYLNHAEQWRHFDPELFDNLGRIVKLENRRVSALQEADLLPGAVYCTEQIPTAGLRIERRAARDEWFQRVKSDLDDCDLLFLDPDNGLETKGFDSGAPKAGKSVGLKELQALQRPGRTIVVYHHQTRMRGGHGYERAHWGKRLREAGFLIVDALRASPFSARAFFLLDASPRIRKNAEQLAGRCSPALSWYPGLGLAEDGAPLSV